MREKLYITKELYKDFETLQDYLETITRSHLNDKGKEVPNPKPLVIAGLGDNRPLTLQEQIKRLFRTEMSHQAHMQGQETFEQANDFDVPEEAGNFPDTTQYSTMEEEFPHVEEPVQPTPPTPPKKEEAPVEPTETPTDPPPSE